MDADFGLDSVEMTEGHTHAICKYARNQWPQLAFDGKVLALTANEITPT
jgi:hypothetical protein